MAAARRGPVSGPMLSRSQPGATLTRIWRVGGGLVAVHAIHVDDIYDTPLMPVMRTALRRGEPNALVLHDIKFGPSR